MRNTRNLISAKSHEGREEREAYFVSPNEHCTHPVWSEKCKEMGRRSFGFRESSRIERVNKRCTKVDSDRDGSVSRGMINSGFD